MIMNDTDHCALSGEGALKFAVEKGFPIKDQNELIYKHVKKTKIPYSKFPGYVRRRFTKASDTVSAVARDKYGHFACAMSTGMLRLYLWLKSRTKPLKHKVDQVISFSYISVS